MEIKRVLLMNPDNTVDKGCIRRLVTPLGLLSVAVVLEQEGFEVSLLDSLCEGYDNTAEHGDYVTYGLGDGDLRRRIEEERPDAVGITCMFSYLESRIYEICRLIKSIDPRIVTVAGGVHPTFACRTMLEECGQLDFIVLREGDYRMPRLLRALSAGGGPAELDGVSFRRDGQVTVNPPAGFIEDLDALPFPARHLADMERYMTINLPSNPFARRTRVERVFTTRGCPYKCCFCDGSSYWGHLRMRGVDRVIEELALLREQYGIEEIQFSDDNMTVDRQRALELFRRMKPLGLVWCTPSGVMATTLDEELIEAMAESGCYQVTISPESGSQRVLREIVHKPIDLKAIKPVVDILHRHDINVHSNFIVGLPGETREELMATFDFAREIGVDSAAFFIAVPYPGTPLYEQCRQRGWLDESYATADFKHANIHIRPDDAEYVMPREELVALVEAKTREFNDWTRARDPGAWERKYALFLESHGDSAERIQGRVV